MELRNYELSILLGSIIGLVFFVSINLASDIDSFVPLLIMIGSMFSINHGYKVIEKNYETKKAGKFRWTIPAFMTVTILITTALTFYDSILSCVVGILLAVISLVLVRLMYRDDKDEANSNVSNLIHEK